MEKLTFAKNTLNKPIKSKLLDAYTTLNHYCQINYTTPTVKLLKYINPRFEPITISINGSEKLSIISAVVFEEKNFHFQKMPFLGNYTFAQTNYRTYCIDKETNKRTVWFFGTTLDHWSLVVPKYIWRFPWHSAKISFKTELSKSNSNKFYDQYKMKAESNWGAAEINVLDQGRKTICSDFPGFKDKESALVYLTHPMSGHFYLNTKPKKLGCWEIYHKQMEPNLGVFDKTKKNYFNLFENLKLIEKEQEPYNILLQNEIDYNIYLPPIESISKNSRYDDNV